MVGHRTCHPPSYSFSRVSVNTQTYVFTFEKLSKMLKVFGPGVSKITVFSCIRPFVFSRTFAHQALRLIKCYFVATNNVLSKVCACVCAHRS